MPNPHANDMLKVSNINTGDPGVDPDEGYSYSDYFQVRFGGKPFRIEPGKTRNLPRYIAEHYAKHLADRMLIRTGKKTNDAKLRPELIEKILPGVESYYGGDEELNPEAADHRRFVREEESLDIGEDDGPMGPLQDPTDDLMSLDTLLEETGDSLDEHPTGETSIVDPSKPLPSMKELKAAAVEVGAEVTGKETKIELAGKVRTAMGV